MLKNRIQYARKMRRRVLESNLPEKDKREGLRLASRLVRFEMGRKRRAKSRVQATW